MASKCFALLVAALALASVAQADKFDAWLFGTEVVAGDPTVPVNDANCAFPATDARSPTGANIYAAGDSDGMSSGPAVVTVKPGPVGPDSFCIELSWFNLASPVTRVHIHQKPLNGLPRGPVVVSFVDESNTGSLVSITSGMFKSCKVNNAINPVPASCANRAASFTPAVSQATLDDILANPGRYYVDIHTGETREVEGKTISFQTNGAIRGALSPWTGCRAAGRNECGETRETLRCC